ncbi:MAG TPA: MBL fold metallo-hydrolase [Verrucomicrobiae bacterium]|nr:MBL fold metallo-hydrolase [Verrucomicrobiae bacterium]
METKTIKLIRYLILPLAIFSLLGFVAWYQNNPDYKLHVNFYDVGQGDSIFIKTYLGTQILLDGGPSNKVLEHLGQDLPFFDRLIDLVILSHPHADHVSGLIEVIKKYKVGKVLMPEVEFDSAAYKEFRSLIEEKKIEKIYAYVGQRIYLDNATVLDIYFPDRGKIVADNNSHGIQSSKRNPNDSSIVAKLSFGKNRFLFTGDAGHDIENLLLPKFNMDADVLKVGHQGSKHSTSDGWLKEVTPIYSVISVGKNSYGHPTNEVLENLQEINSRIFRTDQNGTIRMSSDGYKIFMK